MPDVGAEPVKRSATGQLAGRVDARWTVELVRSSESVGKGRAALYRPGRSDAGRCRGRASERIDRAARGISKGLRGAELFAARGSIVRRGGVIQVCVIHSCSE